MALSAFFLMFFLLQHFMINVTSLLPDDGALFNNISHFMGTNPLVQGLLQPVLIFGVIFHFVMGFILEMQNKGARSVRYAKQNAGANSSWMSRNMLLSGLVILGFLVLHFIDFWIPEINTKYIKGDMSGMHDGSFRYYEELTHKFTYAWRVIVYIVCFILLGMHLMHGFNSAFQSVGAAGSRAKIMRTIGKLYSIIIPGGFIVIALYHFLTHSH